MYPYYWYQKGVYEVTNMSIDGKNLIGIIIGVLVILSMASVLIPVLGDSGDQFQDSSRCADAGGSWNTSNERCFNSATMNVTLGYKKYTSFAFQDLFASSGVLMIVIMAVILIGVIAMIQKNKR